VVNWQATRHRVPNRRPAAQGRGHYAPAAEATHAAGQARLEARLYARERLEVHAQTRVYDGHAQAFFVRVQEPREEEILSGQPA
jgi:hypothetical protein